VCTYGLKIEKGGGRVDVLIAILGVETAILIPVVGWAFKVYGRAQRAVTDAAGWKQSYDREHETTERYRRAEDLANQRQMITDSVLAAIGKLPPKGGGS
jgi:hypothetical protein